MWFWFNDLYYWDWLRLIIFRYQVTFAASYSYKIEKQRAMMVIRNRSPTKSQLKKLTIKEQFYYII
jgi:hypothetical protein